MTDVYVKGKFYAYEDVLKYVIKISRFGFQDTPKKYLLFALQVWKNIYGIYLLLDLFYVLYDIPIIPIFLSSKNVIKKIKVKTRNVLPNVGPDNKRKKCIYLCRNSANYIKNFAHTFSSSHCIKYLRT